jgi:NADP-dependent 3-hydroxy acid dehydrogenase YdfG
LSRLIDRLFSLSGAVCLVTGSSAGIGFALARGLAGAGARVVVNGRTRETVETLNLRTFELLPNFLLFKRIVLQNPARRPPSLR